MGTGYLEITEQALPLVLPFVPPAVRIIGSEKATGFVALVLSCESWPEGHHELSMTVTHTEHGMISRILVRDV